VHQGPMQGGPLREHRLSWSVLLLLALLQLVVSQSFEQPPSLCNTVKSQAGRVEVRSPCLSHAAPEQHRCSCCRS
jgi:hypothetical protein